jgi:glycosyltransferase involved in cell wall biosynthesis
MIIVFCLSEFTEANRFLQPWLTIYHIAKWLAEHGFQVHVISNRGPFRNSSGIQVHRVKSLRNTHAADVISIIDKIKADCLVTTVTPLSLVANSWYASIKNIRKIAFFSYSFYTSSEILKSMKYLSLRDKFEFGRQALIPSSVSLKMLKKNFDCAICQSSRTKKRIENLLNNFSVYKIDPGIDLNIWKFNDKSHNNDTKLLYAGSPLKIRGFWNILEAFSSIERNDITLKILARGAKQREMDKIMRYLATNEMCSRVSVVGGWSDSSSLRNEMCTADLLLLPFVIVPSELPVTLMESIASGTPVLVSDIDGLPDAVGNAGVVTPHADIASLRKAILDFHRDRSKRGALQVACMKKREKMKTWKYVGKIWENVLTG